MIQAQNNHSIFAISSYKRPSSMESRKLQHFLAVCEHGSMQRAAEHCHLTQSALSRSPAALGMAHCLAWLADQAPQVRARMVVGKTDALLEDLRRHVLDLVVVDATAIRDPEGLDIEPLPPLEGGFVCRALHPLSALPRPSLADLGPYAVACSPLSEAFEREIGQSLGKPPHKGDLLRLQSDHYQALKSATLASNMVLLVAHALVRAELDDGRLIALPSAALPTPVGRYALVRSSSRVQLPVMAPLCEVLRERLARA